MPEPSFSCRLYLVSPPRIALDAFAPQAAAALAAGEIAAFRLALADPADVADAVAALKPMVQAAGAAFLLDGAPERAAALDCDGAHVAGGRRAVAAARKALGADRIVGAACGDSRHDAMEAGEAGAEYVAFGRPEAPADADLVSWWQALMETPCVAEGAASLETAAALRAAGADFLAVRELVWDHPEGPAAAVRALLAQIR